MIDHHTVVVAAAREATCAEVGLTEGSVCSVCGLVFTEQHEIPKLPHTIAIDTAVAPTCTENGLTEGTHCTVCSQVIDAQVIIDMLPHAEVIIAGTPATCTEEGVSESVRCSVCCRMLIPAEVLPVVPHVMISEHVDPTCVTEGGLRSVCEVCGTVEMTEAEPILEHVYEVIEVVQPTCLEQGYTMYACTLCGQIKSDFVPALGHSAFALTPQADGKHSWKCERCELTYTGDCQTMKVLVNTDVLTLCAHCMGLTPEEQYDLACVDYCPLCGRFGDGSFTQMPVDAVALDNGMLTLVNTMPAPFDGVIVAISVASLVSGQPAELDLPSVVVPVTAAPGAKLLYVEADTSFTEVTFIQDPDAITIVTPKSGLYLLMAE